VPGLAHRRQGVALAAFAVQRQREQAPGLLAPRVVGQVSTQVRDDTGGTTERQRRGGAAFDRDQPQFLEPVDFGSRPVLVGELGVGGAAPQRQRAVQHGQVAAEHLLEPPGVHVGCEQRVTRALGDQQRRRSPGWTVRLQGFAQSSDERLHRADSSVRRVFPQVGDEGAHRHNPAPRDQQPGQHGALLRAAETRGTRGQRAEHPERHHALTLTLIRC
jgi:hypothetical protein